MGIAGFILSIIAVLLMAFTWYKSHCFSEKSLKIQVDRQRKQATFDLITSLRRGDMEQILMVFNFAWRLHVKQHGINSVQDRDGPQTIPFAEFSDEELVEATYVSLNTITLIATQVAHDHIDEAIIAGYHGEQFSKVAKALAEFVNKYREGTGNARIWAHVDTLAEAWGKGESFATGQKFA